MREVTVRLPHLYSERPYQSRVIDAFERGYRRIIQRWHRRAGKDLTDIAAMVVPATQQRKGTYYHMYPTFNQGRKVMWDGMDSQGIRLIDRFPKELIAGKPNESEMRIELKNGSAWQVVGSDKTNNLMGGNPVGIVFSEFSLHKPDVWDLFSPIMRENKGWAIFNFTPRGKNHAHDLENVARANPKEWHVDVLPVTETGVLTPDEIESERMDCISKNGDDAFFQQEWMVNYNSAVVGAYYVAQLQAAEREGRLGMTGLFDPELPVYDVWDLGVGDAMAIGFWQVDGNEWRMVDYDEQEGKSIPEMIQMCQKKPYVYGLHFAPHDINRRSMSTATAETRWQTARALGWKFEVIPAGKVQDGIDAARSFFRRVWIDPTTCGKFLKLIVQYQKAYDDRNRCFLDHPLHDWTCFAGETEVLTRAGTCRITDLPEGGEILTLCGWQKYLNPRVTRRDAHIVEVSFRDGTKVKCTPDHEFLTDKGWKSAECLTPGSEIQSSLIQLPSFSTVACIACSLAKDIIGRAAQAFIGTFGGRRSGIYRKGITSTTGTVTSPTIHSQTLSACRRRTTCGGLTQKGESAGRRGMPQTNGTDPRPEGCGTAGWRGVRSHGRSGSGWTDRAVSAERCSRGWSGLRVILRSIVLHGARRLLIESVVSTGDRSDVWCMTVPGAGHFSLSNGAVVHNCHGADMFRYSAAAKDRMRSAGRPKERRERAKAVRRYYSKNYN